MADEHLLTKKWKKLWVRFKKKKRTIERFAAIVGKFRTMSELLAHKFYIKQSHRIQSKTREL